MMMMVVVAMMTLKIMMLTIIIIYPSCVFLQELFLPNAIDISFLLWKISFPSYEYFDLCNSSGSKTLQFLLQCTLAQKWSAYSRARKSNISLPNAISCQGPQIHNLISSGTLISLLAPPLLPVFTVCQHLYLASPSILAIFISSTIWLVSLCPNGPHIANKGSRPRLSLLIEMMMNRGWYSWQHF